MELQEIKPIDQFLKENGYKEEKYPVTYPEQTRILYQKQVDTNIPETDVCETNDKLFINIWATKLRDDVLPNAPPQQFEVEIAAEKYDKWWELKCYSLFATDLQKQLTTIESTLIRLFNYI